MAEESVHLGRSIQGFALCMNEACFVRNTTQLSRSVTKKQYYSISRGSHTRSYFIRTS